MCLVCPLVLTAVERLTEPISDGGFNQLRVPHPVPGRWCDVGWGRGDPTRYNIHKEER